MIGNATLYLGDCRYLLSEIAGIDAVITDPPYGIRINTRVNFKETQQWDLARPDLAPLLKIGRYHLFWGGQYFATSLPISEAWATWIKRPLDGITKSQTHSTIEIAWSNFGKPRFFKHVWDGGKRAGRAENREFCHPSQKPVELMEWCIRDLPNDARTILDPFMGSGTTGIACASMGRNFVGIEADGEYFDIACRRVEKAYKQGDLFIRREFNPPTANMELLV